MVSLFTKNGDIITVSKHSIEIYDDELGNTIIIPMSKGDIESLIKILKEKV